jgi:hypothetical protein
MSKFNQILFNSLGMKHRSANFAINLHECKHSFHIALYQGKYPLHRNGDSDLPLKNRQVSCKYRNLLAFEKRKTKVDCLDLKYEGKVIQEATCL